MLYLHPLSASLTTDLVAQLVEHLPFKERVLGSSPSRVTIKRKILIYRWGFLFSEQC